MTIIGESRVEHARRKLVDEYGEDFSPGPGKFEGEPIETYAMWSCSLDSGQDDTLGDVDGFGWYALFAEEGAILTGDSVGFVYGLFYDTAEEARRVWEMLSDEYGEWLDQSDTEI